MANKEWPACTSAGRYSARQSCSGTRCCCSLCGSSGFDCDGGRTALVPLSGDIQSLHDVRSTNYKNGDGAITAYDGDRIMAVFIGDQKNTKAAKVGLQLNWAVKNLVNQGIANQYGSNAYSLNHVVGIDSSELKACRIGVRNDNDIVWVGSAANHAAKLSSIPVAASTVFITQRVHDKLNDSSKFGGNPPRYMWTETHNPNDTSQTLYESRWTWSA